MQDPESDSAAAPETAPQARQQWLFSPARPLVERFGHEFFRALPRTPGVYLMRGQGGRPRRPRVLYVGKAKDLRQRLGSYRHVHPDRDSRKTLRLVHAVEEISWEQCADETAALLRENELLREHRPLFNRANVRPEAHGCIGLRLDEGSLEFRLGEAGDERWHWFGAFKGGRKFALASLLRLLIQTSWPAEAIRTGAPSIAPPAVSSADSCRAMLGAPPLSVEGVPAQYPPHWSALPRELLRDRAPVVFRIPLTFTTEIWPLLHGYFTGRSWQLVDWLARELAQAPLPEPFLAAWRATDLDALRAFYLNATRRNRRWREQLGLDDDELLRPEDLDDLPVKVRLAPEPSPWPVG